MYFVKKNTHVQLVVHVYKKLNFQVYLPIKYPKTIKIKNKVIKIRRNFFLFISILFNI